MAVQTADADAGVITVKPRASHLTRSRIRSAWIFLAPMLLILALVAGWPLLRTIWFSFTDARLNTMGSYEFIGLSNYNFLWDDPVWLQAVWNTFVFSAASVTLETILGMIIALTLNAAFPGRGLLRAAILIPWAIPTIVSAKMWSWMYHDQFGVINDILLNVGLISQPIAWTANPDLALAAVVAVDVWKTTPFMALLILAALQMLPSEVYEAGKVDGIHPVKMFFKVTLPLIRPALIVAIIFRTLDAMRIFDLLYVLTAGSRETASMSIYARQQTIDFTDVGYGSAASTSLFLIIALLTIGYLMLGRVNFGKEN